MNYWFASVSGVRILGRNNVACLANWYSWEKQRFLTFVPKSFSVFPAVSATLSKHITSPYSSLPYIRKPL